MAATRLLTIPRGFWEGEEIRLAQSLLTFDPFHGQPEPPGYPLAVALGRLLSVFIRDPFATLVTLSVIASIAGAYLLARFAGPAAAILLFFSPALLVFGPLPNVESVSLALIIASFYCLSRRQPELFAAAAAAAIGCRPQVAPAMIMVFAIGYVVLPRRRRMLVTFAAGMAVCFIPLVEAVGAGHLREWVATNYEATRVSSEAVGAQGKELAMRFIAHPFGSKFLALPVLALAALGAARAQKSILDLSLVAFAVVHLGFSFAFLDTTDGVQPIIPAMLPMAIFAAAAIPRLAIVLAIVYAAGSVAYTLPVLEARRAASPPMQAAGAIPKDAIALFDPQLEAHARLAGLQARPIRDFGELAGSPARVYLLVDGGSKTPGAKTFAWPDSDAYGKITTERYRVVSAIPVPPARRYRPRAGVYAFERTPEGEEWRWLAKDAAIDLPPIASSVTLRFALPPDAPIESNRITIGSSSVEVPRGGSAELAVHYAPRLLIRSERSFTGPDDSRDLAVQLVSIEQRGVGSR